MTFMELPDDSACMSCGYRLRGLPRPVCPECGRTFDPADPDTYHLISVDPWWKEIGRTISDQTVRSIRFLKRHAVEAIVLLAIGCILAAIMLVPYLEQCRQRDCFDRFKSIGTAIALYQADNSGHYPPNLNALGSYLIPNASPAQMWEALRCPCADTPNYIYLPPENSSDGNRSRKPLLYEPPANHNSGAHVLFADGHITFMSRETFETCLGSSQVKSGRK